MNIEKLNNKKIDIFGTKYTIKILDKIEDEDYRYAGKTLHDELVIEIARNIGNVRVNNEELIRTLLHEISHAICASGQYNNYNNDEQFIEWLSRCMYSLIFKQKLFN